MSSMVNLLQQMMTKCTTEQFWVVSTITGFNALALTQRSDLHGWIGWALAALDILLMVYGVWFVSHRHKAFYYYRIHLTTLVKHAVDVPPSLRWVPSFGKGSKISGVFFYNAWIILSSGITIVALIQAAGVDTLSCTP